MRKLLGTICVLAIVVAVVGYYRGWFVVSRQADPQTDKVHYGIDVDREKIRSDLHKAEAKTEDLAGKALDQVKRHSEQPEKPPTNPVPTPAPAPAGLPPPR